MTKLERQKEIDDIKRFLFWATVSFLIGVLLCVDIYLTNGDSFLDGMERLPYPWLILGLLLGLTTGGWYVCSRMLKQYTENSFDKARLGDFQYFYLFFMFGAPFVFIPQVIKKVKRLRHLQKDGPDVPWQL